MITLRSFGFISLVETGWAAAFTRR